MRSLLCCLITLTVSSGEMACSADNLLAQENLVAWCIVPFDASQRGPEERAVMLQKLGLTKSAYDWRAKHVPEFEAEILAYKKHGIEFFAFWGEHDAAFELFQKHEIQPQIWKMIPGVKGPSQAEKVAQAVTALKPLAERTQKLGCPLSLYNHGGWQGEPANMVAVCLALRDEGYAHVGIVYNFHHGHDQIEDWTQQFKLMQPYLHCLNINGMNDNAQPKILKLSEGQYEVEMLKVVQEAGYDGPIGILDHQGHRDTQEVLQENLEGLEKLKTQLQNDRESTTSDLKKKLR